MRKFVHVVSYLGGTASKAVRLRGADLTIAIYADASHGLHKDGKGHSGLVITVGGDPLFNKSTRQKFVALSSTEAEIIALCDASTYMKWIVDLFAELGLPQTEVPVIYQDNTSTLHMVQNGLTFKKTKHMQIKTHFVKALLDDGVMVLQYLPTEDMIADLLTKPILGAGFVRFSTRFVVYPPDDHKEAVLE